MLILISQKFIKSIQVTLLLASAALLNACTMSCSVRDPAPSQMARLALSNISSPKVMIVGDSISAGPGCYKKYLKQKLEENGVRHFEFVGEYTDDCGGNVMHSAVSCSTALDYTQEHFNLRYCKPEITHLGLAPLMAKHQPDMVMLQLGVNDLWSGQTPVAEVLSRYDTLIAQMRAANPKVVIALAQIQKVITDHCKNHAAYTQVEQLVKALPAWAETKSTEASPIFVADLWTHSDPKDADDCVHPGDQGARKMADNWYHALLPVLSK